MCHQCAMQMSISDGLCGGCPCLIVTVYAAGTSAGVAAKIPVVGILTSQTAQRLTEAGTCHNIKDYTGMLELIKEAGL